MSDSSEKAIRAAFSLSTPSLLGSFDSDNRVARASLVADEIGNALVPVLAWLDAVDTSSIPLDRRETERDAREGIVRLKNLAFALKGKIPCALCGEDLLKPGQKDHACSRIGRTTVKR